MSVLMIRFLILASNYFLGNLKVENIQELIEIKKSPSPEEDDGDKQLKQHRI